MQIINSYTLLRKRKDRKIQKGKKANHINKFKEPNSDIIQYDNIWIHYQ